MAQALVPQVKWIKLAPELAPPIISDPLATLSNWYKGTVAGNAPARPFAPAELVNVPLRTWNRLAVNLLARAKNARYLSKSSGDALFQASLQSVGEPATVLTKAVWNFCLMLNKHPCQ